MKKKFLLSSLSFIAAFFLISKESFSQPCSGTPSPGNTVLLAGSNPTCSSVNFTLGLQHSYSGIIGITYEWRSSPDNITYTYIASATDSIYTTSETSTTYYSCNVTCNNSGLAANSNPLKMIDSLCVGIAELDYDQKGTIYPNPLTSSSTLQLNTQLKNAKVVIYDVLGKEMMRRKMDGTRMEIERGSLVSGVYFVRVSSEERQWVEKLIIE